MIAIVNWKSEAFFSFLKTIYESFSIKKDAVFHGRTQKKEVSEGVDATKPDTALHEV